MGTGDGPGMTHGRRWPAMVLNQVGSAPAPPSATWSTRTDPALVAPARPDDGLTAVLALEELGYESRDLGGDRKSTRLNSSHVEISYAVFCLKKKKTKAQAVSRDAEMREVGEA